MATAIKFAKLNSAIKGYHVYRNSCKTGDNLVYKLETENKHSSNTIKVSRQEEMVGHVPETLAKILAPELMKETILSMEAEVTGAPRNAAEEKWVLGGIEIPCSYKVYGLEKKSATN